MFPCSYLTLRAPKPLSSAYPECLETIGDHIRAKRLHLGLYQREVAERMGVSPFTVINWELGETHPSIRYGPKIIDFLGYDSTPEPGTFGDRIRSLRWRTGWTQKELAEKLDVDATTVRCWERDVHRPMPHLRDRVEALLDRE